MTFDRRSCKLRICVFACVVVILFIYVFKTHLTILSTNLITQVLTANLPSLFPPTLKSITKSKLLIAGSPLNSIPSEAFVTFSNNDRKYLALLTNLLDSVHHFSTRPIIAYGIDVDIDVDTKKYPRLIKRRLNRKKCGPSIYFCKIYAIVESQLDYGVHLEADSVVNWNVDILFDVVHRWPYSLPLAPRHPGDPKNYQKFLKLFQVNPKKRTTPYVHAQFSWNYRAYPFFRRALDLMRQGHFMGANYDETGINILLWKAQANHTLCKIDPYYRYFSAYESNQTICHKYCHSAYIFIHGSKDPTKMRNIFEQLKKYAGSPFIQTPRHGMHYLNETRYTCCYPDSKPSPIHPLICQHKK